MLEIPKEFLPADGEFITEEQITRIDSWLNVHHLTWNEREHARKTLRHHINRSLEHVGAKNISSFSLTHLNRPSVFRGDAAMMQWILNGRVCGHYDTTTKISQGIAAVNFRWHMTNQYLRTLKNRTIVVLSCGIAQEIDKYVMDRNTVILIDPYPDKKN